METKEYQNLVQTLMSNHLAASASEAQRMAKEMIGISEKVHNDSKKKQHYMIKGFKPQNEHVSQASNRPDVDMSTGSPTQSSNPKIVVKPEIQQKPLQPETKTSMLDPAQSQGPAFSNQNPMQNKINELRKRAINPEPVNVQVDFQTPNLDNQQNNEQKTINNAEEQTVNSNFSKNSDLTGQSEFATQSNPNQISPEEYSAKKFGNESIANLQSDFLSLKTPQQSEPTNNLSTDWPAQQLQQNSEPSTTNNFSSSAPTQNNEIIHNFQKEAIEEKTQEIVSEKKESRWTPEEEKLKDQVDLSRVFNFSNK